MLLRPRPPHRSLARRRADADGRTDTAAANRADFTVVLLRDSRGGRRRRRRPPPAFPSARAVNRPLLRGSPFPLPPVRSVVVVLPLLIRTVAGSRAWRKPAADFGQCSSRDGPYRPIDRWETAMNSARKGGRQRRRRKKRRRRRWHRKRRQPRFTFPEDGPLWSVGKVPSFPDMGHKEAVALGTESASH